MKVSKKEKLTDSSIEGTDLVTYIATNEETIELQNALAIRDKWIKLAKHDERFCDFTTYEFEIGVNSVKLKIRSGACG